MSKPISLLGLKRFKIRTYSQIGWNYSQIGQKSGLVLVKLVNIAQRDRKVLVFMHVTAD